MTKIDVYAAVDIGSNAVRLLIYHIYPDANGFTVFKKYALTRVPIRLGEDVFGTGIIGAEKTEKLARTLLAFRHLCYVHGVNHWRVGATSAMREAKNAKEVIQFVKEFSNVDIHLIDGSEEADLMVSVGASELISTEFDYLYIDVGGGSTEITLFQNGQKHFSQSFPIGTVRALQGKVNPNTWQELALACQQFLLNNKPIRGIGSGGNIIKLMKMANNDREDKPLSKAKLKKTYKHLLSLSYEDRIRTLNLNPDRADVIVPAAEIFLLIAKNAGLKDILVPKVGISDGMIRKLYREQPLVQS
jgi:exopolyphosphatase/guanosine-5'-triphosphate,3'-diphosphate pyrophosphatase